MTAQTEMRQLSYRQAVNEALAGELERDPSVVVLGEDIAAYGGVFATTKGLLDRFGPQRVVDTPISEAGFVGMAVGAAIAGMRPVAELMFMDFALVAADQIWNQLAKLRYLSGDKLQIPVTIRTQQGVGPGTAGQHSQSLEALFAHIPGIAVALPATPADAKGLLTAAIRADEPVIVIEHKLLYATKGEVPTGEHVVSLGEAVVRRPGSDVTIVTYGNGVRLALAAAEELAAQDVSAEVVDLRTLVPLDLPTVLASVGRTRRAVVVHEASRSFGAGAELAARITEEAWGSLEAPVGRVGGLDLPVPYAASLEAAWLPSTADVTAAVTQTMRGVLR